MTIAWMVALCLWVGLVGLTVYSGVRVRRGSASPYVLYQWNRGKVVVWAAPVLLGLAYVMGWRY